MSYNSAISIHALREEGDARTRAIMCLTFTFLSTPSARRATTAYQRQTCSDTDFYPRPPRGGRPLALSLEPCDQLISIHALREEGDYHNRADDCRAGQFLSTPSARRATPCPCTPLCSQNKFLSTPSARRATSSALHFAGRRAISIHALREEGDGTHSVNDSKSADFYPRPPRGGRHGFNTTILHHEPFLSTPSARRATAAIPEYYWRKLISIHALREEGDRWILLQLRCSRISIHALREEGDAGRRRSQHSGFYFYPRPPRGGRR